MPHDLNGWVVRHRKALLLALILLATAGFVSIFQLPVAIFPNLTVPRIIITTDAGDLPGDLVVNQITRPLESVVAGVPGVARIRSTTQRGTDELDVSFAWGTDMALALQHVQAAVATAQRDFPPGASVSAELLNPSVFPVMGYSLYSQTLTPERLRQVALLTMRPRLMRVTGVRNVLVQGGDTPDYLVQVDPRSLMQRGVTIDQVQQALAKTNTVGSVGTFSSHYLSYQVLVSGLLHSPDDIRRTTVAVKNRAPITVGDLATVTRGTERRTIATTGDGRDAVLLNIVKQPEGNTVDVARGVHAALASLGTSIPPGITFSLFYDQSQIVLESQGSVIEAVVIGAILALIVMVVFLRDLRAAAVVVSVLPATLLVAFLAMRLFGQSMNIMTLGAIAIALGLVIDDGIVVVEAIYRELEHGHAPLYAVGRGLARMRAAMIGSSLTTIAAFAPLTFLSGVTGQFFGPLALVMTAMLIISLAVSLLIVPLLAGHLLRAPKTKPKASNKLPDKPSRLARFFTAALKRRAWVVAATVPVIILAAVLFGNLQSGFFPEFDEGGFILDYQSPAGTSLAETDVACRKTEAVLAHDPEVASWSRRTGLQLGFDITPINVGDMSVRLVPAGQRRPINEVMDDLRDKVNDAAPELQVDFSQILQDNVGDIAGSPKPVEVKVSGPDFNVLQPLARQIEDVLNKTPGIVDTNNGIIGSGLEGTFTVDTARAQRFGLSADDVNNASKAALDGVEPTSIQEGETAVPVRVLARGSENLTPNTLADLPIASPVTNTLIPISSVADLTTKLGQPSTTRENQRPMIAVTGGLSGRDLGSATRDLQDRIAKQVKLPQGYQIEYGGQYASQQESFQQLALVLAATILLVVTLLVIQFRSFRQTFSLLIAALLSLTGVVLGLAVTGTALNISSMTGTIMVVGIVTENGIVLFDSFNEFLHGRLEGRSEGDPVQCEERLMLDAINERFRPILMTTIGAILALAPLAFGFGAGAAMQKPLAIAVIGGLITSPVMTLLVAPSLYLVMTRINERFARRHPTDEPAAML